MVSTISGILLFVLGLAGGGAVSAYLTHQPRRAGMVLYVCLGVCALCVLGGVGLIGFSLAQRSEKAPPAPVRAVSSAPASTSDPASKSGNERPHSHRMKLPVENFARSRRETERALQPEPPTCSVVNSNNSGNISIGC